MAIGALNRQIRGQPALRPATFPPALGSIGRMATRSTRSQKGEVPPAGKKGEQEALSREERNRDTTFLKEQGLEKE